MRELFIHSTSHKCCCVVHNLGLGALKRKRPHLVAKGIKPVRTPEKNIRTLWRAQVTQEEVPGDVTLEVAGNGFLYRMVRLLAAGLVEVGQGRLSPQQLQQVLAGGDRSKLTEAAPAHGLYLKQVGHGVEGRVQAVVAWQRLLALQGMCHRCGPTTAHVLAKLTSCGVTWVCKQCNAPQPPTHSCIPTLPALLYTPCRCRYCTSCRRV